VIDAGTCNPPLLVFSDDWGRHPSSCQYLIRQLLDRHAVYWVNTIGTRRPRVNLATARRGLEKLRHWAKPSPNAIPLPPNLNIINPLMWPWISTRFDRWLNRRLLIRRLVPLLRSLPTPPVAITTIPIVADLMGRLPVQRWVYYCVDDFSKWPGLDHSALEQLEHRLVDQADVAIAVSETLQEKLAGMGKASHLLTHGVDTAHWATNGRGHPVHELERLERPLIVFWGVVDRRLDVDFVRRLADDLTRGTIVLLGRNDEPDPVLAAIPRVVRIQPLAIEQLPHVAHEAAVLIMPYADLPVTRAMQPLKLKEYLATGRPTVVRDLPANRCWADSLDLAATPEAFSEAVRRRLVDGLPESQRLARTRLAGEAWSAKAGQFEQWAFLKAERSIGPFCDR